MNNNIAKVILSAAFLLPVIAVGSADAQRKGGFDRAAAEMRTQRLHDAKWGVFNHFLAWGCDNAVQWNAKVDGLDVEKVATQLESCGAKFYFFTLMQGRQFLCAPNATFDRIAGVGPGEACSRRDLPAEQRRKGKRLPRAEVEAADAKAAAEEAAEAATR